MRAHTVIPRDKLTTVLRSGQALTHRAQPVFALNARVSRTTLGTIVQPLASSVSAKRASGYVVPRWA